MVEYLEIMGKKYPVRIGYYVMKKVKEETGKSFSEVMEEVKKTRDIEIHELILFAALQMGAYAENQELDLERADMPMILDLVFVEYLELFSSNSFFPEDAQQKIEQAKEGNVQGVESPEKNSKKKNAKTQGPKRTSNVSAASQ